MNFELVSQEDVQVGRKRNTKSSIVDNNMEKDIIVNKKMIPTFILYITPSDKNYKLFTAGPAREHLPKPSVHEVKGAIDMVLTDDDTESIKEAEKDLGEKKTKRLI